MRTTDRKVAEAAFGIKQRREAALDDVLKQENARREAALKNMERIRALRIERDSKNQMVAKVIKQAVGKLKKRA
jgi:hypothetical protein